MKDFQEMAKGSRKMNPQRSTRSQSIDMLAKAREKNTIGESSDPGYLEEKEECWGGGFATEKYSP